MLHGLQTADHGLDARAHLVVALRERGAFGGERFLALAQRTVLFLESIDGDEKFFDTAFEERADLLDSAEYLNKKMREIRDTGKVVGADRIAVIAALNMANELLRLRRQDNEIQGNVSGRVKHMRERVEGALQRTRQLDL